MNDYGSTNVSGLLSIVIPAYNERRRLGRSLERIRDYARRSDTRIEIVVVDDGSTDGTAEVAQAFADEDDAFAGVSVLVNRNNRGKGFSVRRGILHARGDIVLMCDADESAPIEQVDVLRRWLDRGFEVVIGSRDAPDAVLDPPQPILRRWMAWTFRFIRRGVLLGRFSDTQCGFKLFRGDAAREIFARQTIDGWLFDCEVLGLAERLGYRIKELGITWQAHPDSRVRPLRDGLRALRDLLIIRRRLARPESWDVPDAD